MVIVRISFCDTKIEYHNKVLTDNEKQKIIGFMKRHNMPINYTIAIQVFNLWKNGHIDLSKTYQSSHTYIFNEEIRQDISDKIQYIKIQEIIIQKLDAKITDLKRESGEIMRK